MLPSVCMLSICVFMSVHILFIVTKSLLCVTGYRKQFLCTNDEQPTQSGTINQYTVLAN